jgi:hypothetical protein
MVDGELRAFLTLVVERESPIDWLFPRTVCTYRAQMGALIELNAEESPQLLAPQLIVSSHYGLHSWRKTGATLAAAGGLSDDEIMEFGRWTKPRVHALCAGGSDRGRPSHGRAAVPRRCRGG